MNDRTIENRERRQAIRARVIEEYGSVCVCCGETDQRFLSIDHIDNTGHEHRKEIGRGDAIYAWLVKQDFPRDNYQLLCYNCNLGKNINGGVCPHKENDGI